MPCNSRNSRVFVITEPKTHNLDTAKRYGDIQLVFGSDENLAVLWSLDFAAELMQRLDEFAFDCKRDYLLITGSLPPVIMAAHYLSGQFEMYRVLFWDQKQRKYRPYILGLGIEDSGR